MTNTDTIDREIARQIYAKHGKRLVDVENQIRAGDEKGLRLSEPLDRLLDDGHIDAPQWKAGDWLRKTYETARAGGSCMNYDGSPPPESYGSRTQPERIMEAHADLNWCMKALDQIHSARLVDVVCMGTSIEARASTEKCNYRTLRKRLIGSLDELATHLTESRRDF